VVTTRPAEKWLTDLAHTPTASGEERLVADWVGKWVRRRPDLSMTTDSGGNLLITQLRPGSRAPVVAVAHMDHPAFVIVDVADEVAFEFRGGVRPEYFRRATVDFVTGRAVSAVVDRYDPVSRRGTLRIDGPPPMIGDIARWRFASDEPVDGMLAAPAMDDLAGCVASLAALDVARKGDDLPHLGVLLTRAEELGFVGATHAAINRTLSPETRVLSLEASRASASAPVGDGPVIRVGDASSIFDNEMTNRISRAAARSGLTHQRKLMAGGSCEATAFGAFGYRAAGLCLPLANYHNMGNLDRVERGRGRAIPMMEEVSISDFHGLVDLVLVAAASLDHDDDIAGRLEAIYEESRHLLS
jgi:putative aminopeptidase FrvX